MLQTIALNIRDMERTHDTFARVGGEEFAILMPDSDLSDALNNAERIRQSIQALPIEIEPQRSIHVTISAGVVLWQQNETEQEFYKRADEKLYQAKQQGRNCVVS